MVQRLFIRIHALPSSSLHAPTPNGAGRQPEIAALLPDARLHHGAAPLALHCREGADAVLLPASVALRCTTIRPHQLCCPCCREAADAEQHASQLATSAASALQSARSSAALLTGRQGEVEPTDLEDLAASRLDAWLNEHPAAGSFQASGSLTSRGVYRAHSNAVHETRQNTSWPQHAQP